LISGIWNLESSMPASPDPIPDLSPRELRRRLDAGEPLTLLDVREPRERAYCAIAAPATAGDLHIPMREVPARLGEIRAALARGPLVVYCHHGVRSLAVAEWIAERQPGFILNLQGGVEAWSVEVDPAVRRY
jgi:rhodanese-related sulfurtransferase